MSQVDVKILCQDYTLACPDGQEAMLHEAVERVDSHLAQLRDAGKLRSRERSAVLMAVNLAYENLELRAQLHALESQMAALQAQADDDAPLPAATPLMAEDPSTQARLHALLARIDQALGHAGPEATPEDDDGADEAVDVAPPAANTASVAEAAPQAMAAPAPEVWDADAPQAVTALPEADAVTPADMALSPHAAPLASALPQDVHHLHGSGANATADCGDSANTQPQLL